MNRLMIALLFAGALLAQRGTYTVERKSALVAGAEIITVQLPTTADTVTAQMLKAGVYCSVECEITLERDGTAATTIAITPTRLRSADSVVTAAAYRSSNAGVGTVLARYIIAAGATMVLDLVDIRLANGENFSVRISSITGTAIIVIKWREMF